MKKKTLVILLIIPFVIALLTFVSVVALTNSVGVDAQILWNYRENEGFKTNGEYKLEASLSYDESQLLKPGSDTLVWEIGNEVNDNVCSIEEKDDGYYLKTGNETGEATIICRTENRRTSLSFNAHIYDNGLILINPVNQSSGNQIDPTRYYGEYDITYSDDLNQSTLKKNLAKIPLNIEVYSDTGSDYRVDEEATSDNISFDKATSTINVLSEGSATLALVAENESFITASYNFEIVDNGINVYSFNDLMMCTNRSQNGEITVMQVNLESRENALNKDSNGEYINEYKNSNTKLFGNYDFSTGLFDFNDFIYYQDPKLETKFLDQFLEKGNLVQGFKYSTQMKIGVRVQKDFYGNGFTINMHELAYPVHGTIDSITGKLTPNRTLDYFYGPLTYVSIGDAENIPVVRAYLCDNVGFLVDGNSILVNDIKLENANNVDNMYNLGFTGTVLEIQGNNVTIENSVVQNGRTCIRAFSANNLLIDNCLLENAGEFILKLGSNKVNPTDHSKTVQISNDLVNINTSFSEFFDSTYENQNSADYLLSNLFTQESMNSSNAATTLNILDGIQNGLDNLNGIVNEDGTVNYDAHVTINDTYFYNSGVYSIAFESSFNGAYLYNGMPELVRQLASIFGITPRDIGGTSYPVELTLSGDTRFYDWKDVDSIDAGSLIESNFSAYLGQLGDFDVDGNAFAIDNFFPMKAILKEYCIQNKIAYYEAGSDGQVHYYVNRPIAWYGGGYNLSKVINNINQNEYYSYSEPINVDIASDVINGRHVPWSNELISTSTLAKCVIAAIGSHPFKFITNGTITNNEEPILFNEVPSYLDLSSRIVR